MKKVPIRTSINGQSEDVCFTKLSKIMDWNLATAPYSGWLYVFKKEWEWVFEGIDRIDTMEDCRYAVNVRHRYTSIHDNVAKKQIVNEPGDTRIDGATRAILTFIDHLETQKP